MIRKIQFLTIILTISFFISCGINKAKNVEAQFTHDPLIENRDTTISPGENFFQYANNGWFKTHPIPASEKTNGIFLMVGDSIDNIINRLCQSYGAKTDLKKGSNEQKIGDL